MSTTVQPQETASADGYVRLPLAFFCSPHRPRLNIYQRVSVESKPVLLASRNSGLSDSQVVDLQKRGQKSALVLRSEMEAVSEEMLESLECIVADDSIPAEGRFLVLQSVIGLEITRTLRSKDSSRFVAVSQDVGGMIANLVTRQHVSPQKLFDVAAHDTATFVHITNVAAYAVLLAEQLGISDKHERQQIAVGAMLHDIGKRSIPKSILQKVGKLDAAEREVIESHPKLGYVELCKDPNISHGQLMMVYQHHEWINGGGYPVGVLADEIHPWAKLLAVVDVFDALTANRPYRESIGRLEAIEILATGTGTQFDTQVLKCWISIF